MAQDAELRQWRHHYYSLVVRLGMNLCFTVVRQAQWWDGHRLATVLTHGDFIVLPHWNIRQLAPWPANAIPLSRIILTVEVTSINFKVIGLTQPRFENCEAQTRTHDLWIR